MKRTLIGMVAAVVLVSGMAFAVSDGQYDYVRQHCTGSDNNSDHPTYANPACHSLVISLSDYSKHEYFFAGPRMTPDHTAPNTVDVVVDLGTGLKTAWVVDRHGVHGPFHTPGTVAKPATGLRLYFGADDQLDPGGFGEHDSSEFVNNGPSDGGGIAVNLNPATVKTWLAAIAAMNRPAFLSSPIPLVSAGIGSCADGLCISVTSERRVAFKGGDTTGKHRDVSNYAGVVWDPYNCAGPDDKAVNPRTGKDECQDATHPGWNLGDWNNTVGTTYVEPGFQLFEDPDPEGSPGVLSLVGIPRDDPYPLPAFYFGSCGVIIGGGPAMKMPAGPMTNSAHQLVIATGCN